MKKGILWVLLIVIIVIGIWFILFKILIDKWPSETLIPTQAISTSTEDKLNNVTTSFTGINRNESKLIVTDTEVNEIQ